MDNPLAGVMEWYQGLPQAAQIGIPIVGVGAVYLISKGKGGGTGSLVSGPFGSSTGGGQAVSGAGNAGGSNGNGGGGGNTGTTGGGTTPTGGLDAHQLHVLHMQHLQHITKAAPKPPSTGSRGVPKPVAVGHKPEPVKPKAQGLTKHPVLPSSHIQQHPALAHQVLPSSHIQSSVANSKATAVGYTPPGSKGPLIVSNAGGPKSAAGKPGVVNSKPVIATAPHPVNSKTLANRVPAAKTHQTVNDKNRLADNALTKRANARVAL